MATTVTLDIFSGRSNPTWQLDQQQEKEFKARIASLNTITEDRPTGVIGGLGYRGFMISRHGTALSVSGQMRIHEAIVDRGAAGANLVDKNEIERFLLTTVPGGLPTGVRSNITTQLNRMSQFGVNAGQPSCPPCHAADAPTYNPSSWNNPAVQPRTTATTTPTITRLTRLRSLGAPTEFSFLRWTAVLFSMAQPLKAWRLRRISPRPCRREQAGMLRWSSGRAPIITGIVKIALDAGLTSLGNPPLEMSTMPAFRSVTPKAAIAGLTLTSAITWSPGEAYPSLDRYIVTNSAVSSGVCRVMDRADIEIDIFSGRPNPRLEIVGSSAADLLDALVRPHKVLHESLPDGLGFRGFIVRTNAPDPKTFRVSGHLIAKGTQIFDDPHEEAYSLILSVLPENMKDLVRPFVGSKAARP